VQKSLAAEEQDKTGDGCNIIIYRVPESPARQQKKEELTTKDSLSNS